MLAIEYAKETGKYPKLGDDESYTLTVHTTGAELKAATDIGAMRGLETFLQLITADNQGFGVPVLAIVDHPRFPWRGLSYDVSRHWMPIDVVKRNLDAMAAVKMNVLHLHLTDNQGFRVESKQYPKLQAMGSDGHYYTQDQVREIVDYAADRGIRIIPEFDMPGHTTSWLVGYPELGTAGGPYKIERAWGVFDEALDPTKEEVYRFLDRLIGEMTALFPDDYFHIGGDKVNGKAWSASEHVSAFKKAHGMKDNEALQAYFTKRVQQIVERHGKRMVGWDEVLTPEMPKNILVQSWRGQKSLAEAARQGVQGILSAGYYLDLMHSTAQHYAVDPLEGATADLNPEEAKRIIGGEAAMWSEYASTETIDSRVWPRAAAIAERLWSPQSTKDVQSMYRRMNQVDIDLQYVGVTDRTNYVPMLERIAGGPEIAPVRVVADIVEPPREYMRGEQSAYTQQTPLNRLVDAARPESDTARHFGETVDRYLETRSDADRNAVRAALTAWRANDAGVEQLGNRTFLMKDVVAASLALRKCARSASKRWTAPPTMPPGDRTKSRD